jgi:hypothetical protein
MTGDFPYATAAAFRNALKDLFSEIAKSDSGFSIGELQRQFAYDRALARIFTSPRADQWVGGRRAPRSVLTMPNILRGTGRKQVSGLGMRVGGNPSRVRISYPPPSGFGRSASAALRPGMVEGKTPGVRGVPAIRSRREPGRSKALHAQRPEVALTVVLPEMVTARLWQQALHSNVGRRLKRALRGHRGIVITSVPFHLPR